jgi:hypothetical protein
MPAAMKVALPVATRADCDVCGSAGKELYAQWLEPTGTLSGQSAEQIGQPPRSLQ